MNNLVSTTQSVAPTNLHEVGQLANSVAAQHVFSDYTQRKSQNTLRAQRTDLTTFAEFLSIAGIQQDAETLQTAPDAWQGITWGIVESFVKWMLQQGYATGSVNRKLSTVKMYAKLACKAGVINTTELALIKNVAGYSKKEAKRIDEQREVSRIGRKKAEHVSICHEQAQRLKTHPSTPQGRRDAVLMCLLLDHGLRCGEVAILKSSAFNIEEGIFNFYRPKVDAEQKHRMSHDTQTAIREWIASGDAPNEGPLLRGSRKGGTLRESGMSEQAITARVKTLGESIGLDSLSAHDCRHYWATRATQAGTDAFALRDAGGWSSMAMPSRYVEASTIANERVRL